MSPHVAAFWLSSETAQQFDLGRNEALSFVSISERNIRIPITSVHIKDILPWSPPQLPNLQPWYHHQAEGQTLFHTLFH